MNPVVKKTAAEEVLDLLTEYSISGNYSTMDLKRVERDVLKMLDNGHVEPSQAHMLFGIIGFLLGDRTKTESAFRNALKLSPNDVVIYLNATMGLASIGNFREARDLIRVTLERFPDDKMALARSMVHASQEMQLQLVKSIMSKYEKLTANGDTQNISTFAQTATRTLAAFESSGLSDDDLLVRLEVAAATIRAKGIELRKTSTFTLNDGSVIYNIYLTVDSATCAEINFEIADALIESFADTGMEYFSILCRPYSDYIELIGRGDH